MSTAQGGRTPHTTRLTATSENTIRQNEEREKRGERERERERREEEQGRVQGGRRGGDGECVMDVGEREERQREGK